MLVYVASPISSNPELHLEKALEVGNIIIDKGHSPFIPNLFYYMEKITPRDYETWMRVDEGWLRVSDAVLRIEGVSLGADREVLLAEKLGKHIYFSVEELPKI